MGSNTRVKRTYGEYNDEELVRLAQHGDKDAEHAVVMRFMGLVRLKTRPYFLIGADNADLLQEGAIGLVSAIREYSTDRGGAFRPFAETCIVRQLFTAIKSATRKKHIPLNNYVSLDKSTYEDSDESESTLLDTMIQPGSVNPEDVFLEREEYRELVIRIEDELTELERDVLKLFIAGKSYGDIAEELGKTTKSVDNAIQRVKKKVSIILKTMDVK